jgi:CRP/FNR family transcriptional regulator
MAQRVLPAYPRERMLQFGELRPDDLSLVADLAGPAFALKPRRTIRRQGDPVDAFYLLHEGWVASSTLGANGGRLIMKLHLAGDVLGAPSLALSHAAETLTTLTAATVSALPLSALTVIFTRAPRLAAVFFLNTQLERVILCERLASIGRSSAESRLAALLLHLRDRVGTEAIDGGERLYLPLTQTDLGDVVGLTPVHVNRTMRALEARGLVSRALKHVHLRDLDGLRSVAGAEPHRIARNPDWLPPADWPDHTA